MVSTETSDSTYLSKVVELPPPTPFSTCPYQPEDFLPLSEYDAGIVGLMNARLIVLKVFDCCMRRFDFDFGSENAINVSGAAFPGHKLFSLSEYWKGVSEQF